MFPAISDLGPIAARMRAVKDPDELAALKRAAHIVDIGIAAAASAIAPGITEREVAAAAERAMLAAGADSVRSMPCWPGLTRHSRMARPATTRCARATW